ncbi:LytR/AlgR family response regulator transcription factor [Mucilaginibacter paludis]|uniref:Two component transcriptional regulator, LytTR family n=1 Tax=Mucilaginibacter paludis DSM 18603 TaxID=714943 RepID=H1YHH1_9SPHI|nr:response regulator [Mucilaginibacter paludis]EHQ25505.1 two component transcriptional regulator, LytTR family [Mucilaginibacter paludis DSM 18603]
MIRCIIVDDEPLALEVLEHFISRTPQLELVANCCNAVDAFKVLHDQQVDLMFLDIKMPGISGLDFVSSLKNPPSIIFTTAFAEHAVRGFELEAIDYLLKPITFERFEKSIRKLLKMRPPEPADVKDYTYFRVSGRLIKIFHADLLYAQSVKDYILICTKSGNHLTHMTMKYLAELLPSPPFLRVHRSYLVKREAIDQVERNSIRVNAEIIPVGENYRGNLEKIT